MSETQHAMKAFTLSPSTRRRLDADASPVQAIAICAAASLISLLFTGFVFGIDNNLFHLPILQRLYDEDQFRSDAFIQSLRFYSSGVWLVLAGAGKYVGDGHLLFLALLYVSRLLSFIGFAACASLAGVRSVREQAVFCLVICFVEILDGASLAGYGGLFLSSFTHSEFANGTILLAIYFAARARIAVALVFAGLTFFINAFMGVWLALPLAAITASHLWRHRIDGGRLVLELAIGAAAYAILVAPVVYNILSNPDFGKSFGFDFAAYLRDYFGAHFFLDANPVHEIVLLFVLAALGWLALSRLHDSEPALKAALAAAVALYGIGIVAPTVTTNPIVLNLHLLRSGVMIHLLAAVSAAALATKWLSSADGRESTVLGPYLLFFLSIKFLFPAAVALVAFKDAIRGAGEGRDVRLRAIILIALGVAVLPWRAWQHFSLTSAAASAASEWETVGNWAKSSTAPGSMFLISAARDGAGADTEANKRRADAIAVSSVVFEASSHRRIWVDAKRGAAVMWRPSYQAVWRSRVDALQDVRTMRETLSFAERNGIDYVVGDCQAFRAAHIEPVFRTAALCVSASQDGAQGRRANSVTAPF